MATIYHGLYAIGQHFQSHVKIKKFCKTDNSIIEYITLIINGVGGVGFLLLPMLQLISENMQWNY